MVIAHEAEMRQQGGEIVPAGESRCSDQQALEVAVLLDIRIDDRGERAEVGGPQWPLGFQGEDSALAQQFVLDHRWAPRWLRSCRVRPLHRCYQSNQSGIFGALPPH